MLSFAFYLLKVIICSAVLFGYYWFFLRNKIYHAYNRFYLLAIIVISLTLPIVQINIWHKATEPKNTVIRMLQVVNTSDEYLDEIILYSHYNHISKEQAITYLYLLISFVFLFLLLKAFVSIWRLLKNNKATSIENIHFIVTNAKGTPFSFFRFIFWNEAIDITSKAGRQIFKHEIAHVQEKHSYDKVFINIILIVFWSNPVFWLIRKELNMIHEFIADKKAVEDGDTSDFAAMILHATYPQHNFQLANNFFYSPIKRRLIMLTKQNKKQVSYISRLLVLPLAAMVFAAFTIKAKTYHEQINNVAGPLTVVIDAGHGGNDGGAKAADGTLEKDISLAYAKKIKELNTSSDIRIILTRESDVLRNVSDRAAFANKNNADLFISIHVSSGPEAQRNKVSGMEIYVAKEENRYSEASRLLASAIIANFQNNYGLKVQPNPMQPKGSKIRVLEESKCAAVVIEAGYMINDQDLAYLNSDKATETFARNILSSIESYANSRTQQLNSFKLSTDSLIFNSKSKPDPLFILNGAELSLADYKKIDQATIKHFNVLTGQEAIKKYGAKAKDGVFEIILKTGPDFKPLLNRIKEDIYVDASQALPYPNKQQIEAIQATNYTTGNTPLFIVNGKETSKSTAMAIDPSMINDIRVLKPATAVPTYGNKASNGVIIINARAASIPKDALIIIDERIYEGMEWQEALRAAGMREIEKLSILEKSTAIEKYGLAAKQGAIEVTTKSPGISNQEPTITLSGFSGPGIHIDQLKKIKELRSNFAEYSIVSARLFFSGSGFPHVIVAELRGGSLEAVQQYLDRVVTGSNLTVDNIKVKTKEGQLMVIKDRSFSFIDKEESSILNGKIFTKVEIEPDFPGGKAAWQDYLRKNLDANTPVNEGWSAGTYKIIVQFLVDEAGNVSDVKTSDHPNSKTAKQCVELIKNGPKWLPARQNGKVVKAYKKQPITFVVSEQ